MFAIENEDQLCLNRSARAVVLLLVPLPMATTSFPRASSSRGRDTLGIDDLQLQGVHTLLLISPAENGHDRLLGISTTESTEGDRGGLTLTNNLHLMPPPPSAATPVNSYRWKKVSASSVKRQNADLELFTAERESFVRATRGHSGGEWKGQGSMAYLAVRRLDL